MEILLKLDEAIVDLDCLLMVKAKCHYVIIHVIMFPKRGKPRDSISASSVTPSPPSLRNTSTSHFLPYHLPCALSYIEIQTTSNPSAQEHITP